MKRKKPKRLSATQLQNIKSLIQAYESDVFYEKWANDFRSEWKKIKGPYSDSRPFEAYNLMSFWFSKLDDFLKGTP